MVGAQMAMKMASNLLPARNIYSETTMMESTTSSKTMFMTPTLLIKFFSIPIFYINFKNTQIRKVGRAI